MARFNSRVSVFTIVDTGGDERDLSSYITEIDGLPGERELQEDTVLGSAGYRRDPGLENSPIRIAGVYDDTATTGPDAVLGPLRTHTAATTVEYGPKGSTNGFPRYTCTAWVRNYKVTSRVKEMVFWTAELESNGAVTRDVFA